MTLRRRAIVGACGFIALVLVSAAAVVALNREHMAPPSSTGHSAQSGPLGFSTFFGGSRYDGIRDVATDSEGNVYVTGGTTSRNFPTTLGPAFDDGPCASLGGAGSSDAFVAKFARTGQLMWSRLLGGPCHDRTYAIEVDGQGFVYLAGRAGAGFPTTPGVVQPDFGGETGPLGAYGTQDGFIAKLSTDGAQVVWSTYLGGNDGGAIRDIAVDDVGDVYLVMAGVLRPNPHVGDGAFQRSPRGGEDVMVAKLSSDGARIHWATYFGGSGDDGSASSIRIGRDRSAYVLGDTNSSDLATTAGAYQRRPGGGSDLFLVRFTADGSNIVFSTYLGGSGDDGLETHQLALDSHGNAYVAAWTKSGDFPTTGAAFQPRSRGSVEAVVAQISADGAQLLASTYLGGRDDELPEGIDVDGQGNVVVFGATASGDFPVTPGAVQTANRGRGDAFVARLSPDLGQLLFSTYVGGSAEDGARSGVVDPNGDPILGGATQSDDWPTRDAVQNRRGGDSDAMIARLSLNSR